MNLIKGEIQGYLGATMKTAVKAAGKCEDEFWNNPLRSCTKLELDLGDCQVLYKPSAEPRASVMSCFAKCDIKGVQDKISKAQDFAQKAAAVADGLDKQMEEAADAAEKGTGSLSSLREKAEGLAAGAGAKIREAQAKRDEGKAGGSKAGAEAPEGNED